MIGMEFDLMIARRRDTPYYQFPMVFFKVLQAVYITRCWMLKIISMWDLLVLVAERRPKTETSSSARS